MTAIDSEPPPYADLIEYMAKMIAEKPDAVSVTEDWEDDQRVILRLLCDEEDMGRIIGRGGRVAQAMRALLRVAAVRSGDRALLQIG